VCHFANDPVQRETLFRLGLGAVVAENLRDLSPLEGAVAGEIVEERDASLILELAREHGRYYRGSPIFLLKAEGDLAELAGQEGDPGGRALFVCREEGKPVAYFVVGPCRGEGEGLLLADTNTAQILSAYAGSDARGRGIGRALLGTCIEWARRKGYDRLFVEHETANIWGGNFWRRHFSPFLYASMRYVDSSL
jgi:GNAT superfamily N-acetyltransferase